MSDKPATIKNQPSLAEVFAKRGKIVLDLLRATPEAGAAFKALATAMLKDAKSDWTEKAPNYFSTVALVQPDDEKLPPRLIGISDREHVFSDPVVAQRLYQSYVSRVVSAAAKDDADPADFVTTGGTYRQAFDMTSFQFQAGAVVRALKDQGVAGMTSKLLRLSLENAAYARSMFPRITDQSWEMIFNLMIGNATQRNLDTSIFAHWLQTRQVKVETGAALDLSGFAAVVNERLAEKEETSETAETIATA